MSALGVSVAAPATGVSVAGTTAFTWVGGGTSSALVTIGTQGTAGSSLFVNTPSLNSSFASGLAIDGTYPGGTGISVINVKAVGVQSGGGYGSDLAFHTASGVTLTEQMRISSAGNITASTGNVVINTALKGINFTANTNAPGMTSELLNWYEEGTWTPVFTPSTSGSITLTSPTNSMRYTRVGRLVTLTGLIDVASVSSPVGDLRLTGIPFNIGGSGAGSVSVYGLGTTSTATAYQVLVDSGSATTVFIRGYNAGSQVATVANNVQGGSGFYLTIQYTA
jgi:hypothetical protein